MHYCFQEKETVGLVFRRELVHYCSQEKKSIGLLFWRELVHYCSKEKKIVRLLFWRKLVQCAILFSGEGNRQSSVSKRTGTLLSSREENCSSTVLKRTCAMWTTVLMRRDRRSSVLKSTGGLQRQHLSAVKNRKLCGAALAQKGELCGENCQIMRRNCGEISIKVRWLCGI